jgi:hypothetical protein
MVLAMPGMLRHNNFGDIDSDIFVNSILNPRWNWKANVGGS